MMTATECSASRDWIDVPLVPGDWRDIDGLDAEALLARLNMADDGMEFGPLLERHRVHNVRIAPLPFYADTLLVEVQVGAMDGGEDYARIASALYGPHGAIWLTGQRETLHRRNALGIKLTTKTQAIAYLRFFCAHVHGAQHGPFLVIGDANELAFANGTDETDRAATIAQIVPPVCRKSADRWVITVTILYGATLFAANFEVHMGGLVEMVDEEELPVQPRLRLRKYLGIYRSAVE